jgi:hypothetical protein
MTKAELLAALAGVGDDADILTPDGLAIQRIVIANHGRVVYLVDEESKDTEYGYDDTESSQAEGR